MSQTSQKSRKRLGLFLTSFFLGILIASGFSFWFLREDYSAIPPCAEFVGPYQFDFKPNCAGEIVTPRGLVSFYSNEDGLRDVSREEILKNEERILVLGDSLVEGVWLKSEESLSQRLKEKLPSKYFINAGVREKGPLWQIAHLKKILPIYRPQSILWIIDEQSLKSDNIACQVLGNTPEAQKKFDRDIRAGSWLGQRIANKLRAKFYQNSRQALSSAEGGPADCHCTGIRQMGDYAAKNQLSFFPVAILGGRSAQQKKLEACLNDWNKGGRPFLSFDASRWPDYYFLGTENINPSGVDKIVHEITQRTEF